MTSQNRREGRGNFHYSTRDADIIAAFKKWREERERWGDAIEQVAASVGREAAVSSGARGATFFGVGRTDADSRDPAAYKGTPWVLSDTGFLRPRLSHRAGKAFADRMNAVKSMRHPAEDLVGIPKMYGFLGRPGMLLADEERLLIVTYSERVKHDHRWTEIKESEYWLARERTEEARSVTA